MVQISPTMFIMTSGLVMFFFLSGVAIFLLLEMGVTNVGGQKRLVHLFMKNPWKVEALIICLLCSFPISIISISLIAKDSSLLSLVAIFVVAWPFLIYVFHRRMMDFHQVLGIGKKKEYDPIFVARVSIIVWIIAACGIVLSFLLSIFDISQEMSYLLVGSCGMVIFFIPFRKSLAIVRNRNTIADAELE